MPCGCGCLLAISRAVMRSAMAWLLATITWLLVRTCCSSAVTSWGCAADGTTESSANRTMSTMGPAGPASPTATASERGWGRLTSPQGVRLYCRDLDHHHDAKVLNRRRRELDNNKVDQVQIGTRIRTTALLFRSSVTTHTAPCRSTPSLPALLL